MEKAANSIFNDNEKGTEVRYNNDHKMQISTYSIDHGMHVVPSQGKQMTFKRHTVRRLQISTVNLQKKLIVKQEQLPSVKNLLRQNFLR